MGWIKRNLFFLIGIVVAVALIGVGGYFLWTQMNQSESQADEAGKLAEDYRQMQTKDPQPGQPNTPTDNVKAARDQQNEVRQWIQKAGGVFKKVPAIAVANDFANQLNDNVVHLQRSAEQAGVNIPKGYSFTFQAQKTMLNIPRGSVAALAQHLAEIKAICEVVYSAKVNSLTSIQRELVQNSGDTNLSDYLPPEFKTEIGPAWTLTPYQLTFDCFSGELAAVMSGFANSPYGLVVKAINVEPSAPSIVVGAPPVIAPVGPGTPPPPGRPGTGPRGTRRGGPPPPPAGARPITLVSENRLKVSVLIEVVKANNTR